MIRTINTADGPKQHGTLEPPKKVCSGLTMVSLDYGTPIYRSDAVDLDNRTRITLPDGRTGTISTSAIGDSRVSAIVYRIHASSEIPVIQVLRYESVYDAYPLFTGCLVLNVDEDRQA